MRFRLDARKTFRAGPLRLTTPRGLTAGARRGRVSASVGRGPSVSVRLLRGLRATLRG